jgi:uncharacterized integral membrane protein (TIGR00698 family)
MSSLTSEAKRIAPGLSLAIAGVIIAFQIHRVVKDPAPLVLAVLFGFVAGNLRIVGPGHQPGIKFAVKKLLRIGVVLLGFRLSLGQLQKIGLRGVFAVALVVSITFFFTRWFAKRLGLSQDLGLLVATGYSICGASAIAAVQPLTNAEDEEVTYAVALVTLCGSLSIAVLPAVGHLLHMKAGPFGAFAGAAVHDVAQVVATASSFSPDSTASATVVKLTRVVLLAPLVMTLSALRTRQARKDLASDPIRPGADAAAARPPILPLFLAGFLVAIAISSTGWLSSHSLKTIKLTEQYFLATALFALGANVSVAKLRKVGGKPLLLGLVSWVVVASMALISTRVFRVGA